MNVRGPEKYSVYFLSKFIWANNLKKKNGKPDYYGKQANFSGQKTQFLKIYKRNQTYQVNELFWKKLINGQNIEQNCKTWVQQWWVIGNQFRSSNIFLEVLEIEYDENWDLKMI